MIGNVSFALYQSESRQPVSHVATVAYIVSKLFSGHSNLHVAVLKAQEHVQYVTDFSKWQTTGRTKFGVVPPGSEDQTRQSLTERQNCTKFSVEN
jgi:hypothetical protein